MYFSSLSCSVRMSQNSHCWKGWELRLYFLCKNTVPGKTKQMFFFLLILQKIVLFIFFSFKLHVFERKIWRDVSKNGIIWKKNFYLYFWQISLRVLTDFLLFEFYAFSWATMTLSKTSFITTYYFFSLC